MLEWGNSQQKNISYKPQTISVVEIIQDTISFLKQIAKNKSIEIRFEIKNDYYVFADAQLLSIAIRNILNNSIKFTPRGGVIYVSCYSDNDLLKICIKDTGIGIPENRLHKILDNSEIQSIPGTENEKGSGLGLKLTLEFIKINNGDIKIESEPNNGTIVTLCLPLLNKQDIVQKECNENPSDIIKDDTLINYNLFDESTILIVDDNSSYREYLSEVLGDFLNIIEAENGENGLKLAIEYSPDIIISDIDMPQMDGISMCKAIQNRKETSHIPLILVTAKADKSYKEIGLSSGAIDILNKPFSKKELIQKLHNILLIRQRIQDNILTHRLSGNDVKNKINPFVDKLITIIENNYSDTQFNVEKLTELMAMSRSTLIRKCISLVNKKPSDLIIEYRLQTAKKMLDDDFDNVSEIAYQTGFSDPRYFSRRFKMQFGISPSEYKSNKPE